MFTIIKLITGSHLIPQQRICHFHKWAAAQRHSDSEEKVDEWTWEEQQRTERTAEEVGVFTGKLQLKQAQPEPHLITSPSLQAHFTSKLF